MCDIYSHYCFICGKPVEMHLGDYNTERWEILVICHKCMKNINQLWFSCKCQYVDWKVSRKGIVRVYSLTDNAFNNRDFNHPNESKIEQIEP